MLHLRNAYSGLHVNDDLHSIEEMRRQSAVESVDILDTPPEERFERLARIARNQFKVPIVLITFMDGERQWFKSHLGTDETEGPRAISFCNQTIQDDRVLYVADVTRDDRFRDNPQVTGIPHIRFYAGAPVRTPDGQCIGTLCLVDFKPRTLDEDDLQSIRDLADCVEMELLRSDRAAIHAAHLASRARAVIETVDDAILTLDDRGVVRTANAAAASVFAYQVEQLIGAPFDSLLMPEYHFQSDPIVEVNGDRVSIEADQGEQYVEGRRKDGSSFHMQLSITEMAHFNQRQFVVVARDVNEQKTKELFLDAIIENIPNMVFVKEAEELRFTLFNRAGEKLIGASRDILLGKTDFDFVPREQAEAFTLKDREVLEQSGVADIWEEPIDTPNMGRRILHTRKVAIRDERGVARYLLGISEDITERKRIERELAESLEETERASRGKSEFLANMSHELRSPLNSIIGFAEIMRDGRFGDLEERYKQCAADIFGSASHLLELINEILDISRIEAGELTLDETHFDLADPVGDAVRFTAVHAEEKGQALENAVAPGDFQVFADARQLRQILINLLSNAVRFTPEGGRIAVTCSADADGVSISVTDNGIGIAEEDIPRVLEPFGQVRRGSLQAHGGTGLGLTLSKRLTEIHGGSLAIESTLGEGTTVSVSLPRERLVQAR